MSEATIRDVARRAEVSIASVSRVLNRLGNVGEATRVRVEDAIRELGYVPHAGARSLSLARAHAIGVMLPDLHGEFFSEIMRGMDREASKRGYLLLLSNMHRDSQDVVTALSTMRGRVDGLLVMAPHLETDALERALPALPTILINPPAQIADRTSVRLNNAAGVDAIVKHLVATGRKRIVHIRGPLENVDAQERDAAFRAAMARLLPGEDVRVVQGQFTDESGESATSELLQSGATFDAIFAGNDIMAIGALQALRRSSLRTPEDVAVAGFDDIPLARHLDLTTARVHIAELGIRAVELLTAALDGGDKLVRQELHAPTLVIRATSRLDGSKNR